MDRAKRPARIPSVLTREEVRAVLSHLSLTDWLMSLIEPKLSSKLLVVHLNMVLLDIDWLDPVATDRGSVLAGNLE